MQFRGSGDDYLGETGNGLSQLASVHNQQIGNPKSRLLCKIENISKYMCSTITYNVLYYFFFSIH